MSLIITQAVPAAPEGPSFTPTNDARSQSDRGSTFGPALSDARQRMASHDTARPEPSTPRSDSADPDNGGEPSELPSERTNTSKPDATGTEVDEPAEDVASTTAPTPADESTPPAQTGLSTAPPATAAAVAATLLPTAKGTTGDGDSSIDPTVEAVAAPDPLADVADVDSSAITDSVNDLDIENTTASNADTTEAAIEEAGRQTAPTSLEQVSDADLDRADHIGLVTTEQVASPSVAADEAVKADPSPRVSGGEARVEAPMQGRIAETNTNRSSTGQASAAADVLVEEALDTPVGESPVIEGDTPDRPVQQSSIGTVARSDTPESVVVLAREAAAPAAAAVKSTPPTTQPSVPLPAGAEANLWEDVRSAFDRIRSTGDGQELLMRLRPAELGDLLVQVRTQGEHISVRLVTSSAAAQQTLVDDRLRLAAELARAGFDEGSVDIGQSDTGDANQRRDQRGAGRDANHPGNSLGTVLGLDRAGTVRDIFERRDPIRTEIGFRPGRTALSTINLTL